MLVAVNCKWCCILIGQLWAMADLVLLLGCCFAAGAAES